MHVSKCVGPISRHRTRMHVPRRDCHLHELCGHVSRHSERCSELMCNYLVLMLLAARAYENSGNCNYDNRKLVFCRIHDCMRVWLQRILSLHRSDVSTCALTACEIHQYQHVHHVHGRGCWGTGQGAIIKILWTLLRTINLCATGYWDEPILNVQLSADCVAGYQSFVYNVYWLSKKVPNWLSPNARTMKHSTYWTEPIAFASLTNVRQEESPPECYGSR